MRDPNKKYDFKAIGQAVKAARENKEWTREQVAEMMDVTFETIKRQPSHWCKSVCPFNSAPDLAELVFSYSTHFFLCPLTRSAAGITALGDGLIILR